MIIIKLTIFFDTNLQIGKMWYNNDRFRGLVQTLDSFVLAFFSNLGGNLCISMIIRKTLEKLLCQVN